MAITEVWLPPAHEELSILPEETALSLNGEGVVVRTVETALKVADRLGTLAGAGIGFVAGLVNTGADLIDKYYERRK